MIFGETPVTPEEIVELLSKKLQDTAKPIADKDKDKETTRWTRAFREVLTGLVKEHNGCAVYTGSPDSEFMLDFVWWGPDEGGAKRVIMGAESEWAWNHPRAISVEEIAKDFRKLLCFKAPLKLLVFDCCPERRKEVPDKLRDCLRQYAQHVEGEQYIILEYYGNKPYSYEAHICRVERDGAMAEVRFVPIGGSHPHACRWCQQS